MKTNLRHAICGLAIAAITSCPVLAADTAKAAPAVEAPVIAKEGSDVTKVQMAILLDCSGSMSGLLNQARTQLWQTVNEFTRAEYGGKPVMLEVAVYEYGSGIHEGYMKQLLPLTDDLDRVSEVLFELKTTGSAEYCGQAIQAATQNLKWSDKHRDLKVIFIAGNEPFTQGPVDYRKACEGAIKRDITVNTIHCGPEAAGIAGKWKQGALLADGSFMTIDQNQTIVAIPTPQDEELVKLNGNLNKTYIAYGTAEQQHAAVARQTAQDANAAGSNVSSLANRINFKANVQYSNARWDLVDACKNKDFKLADVKEENLPEVLRKLKSEERQPYLDNLAKKRGEIQEQIKKVNTARSKFLVEARKKQAKETGNTLDEAMIAAARKQAIAKQYTFKKE